MSEEAYKSDKEKKRNGVQSSNDTQNKDHNGSITSKVLAPRVSEIAALSSSCERYREYIFLQVCATRAFRTIVTNC